MQQQLREPPTQATWAAAAASDTPSSRREHARQAEKQDSDEETDKSASANRQARASNELIGEEAARSLAYEALANRTSSTWLESDFDEPTNDQDYEDETTAATSVSPTTAAVDVEGENESEPGLRRRVSLMASLVPDNKRLAALLAGKGPISSELKKLAKSSGLSKALAERARRRNRASTAKPSPKTAQKQSSANASQKTHAPAAAKSMQTRQGLATTMASSAQDQLNASNLSHLAHNNQQLRQQLSMMSTGGGGSATLPQLSSAIQRLISLGKFGIAGGGVPAASVQQQMLLAHLNSNKRNNQTMSSSLFSSGTSSGGHQKKQSYHHDHGDFSLTSANDASPDVSSTGVGRFHSHSAAAAAADDLDGDWPFELASASALPGEQQVPQPELGETNETEIGHQQLPSSSARLAELMSRWQTQMAGGPSDVSATSSHEGGLLSLQAAQQRNKLAAAAAATGHSLLDLPTSGSIGGGGGATNKQQLIPVEIIGLDPSVTNSILYGSSRQQEQHARLTPASLQPLLSATTSHRDHYQQIGAHAAPPGSDYANYQQPNGSQAASELDIHAPPTGEQHDSVYSNVITGGRGEKVLDSDSGGQEPASHLPHGNKDRQPIAPSHSKQSPVLHVHHFHHTSNEPVTSAGHQQEQEKTELVSQQDNNGQLDPASRQQVVSGSGLVTGGGGGDGGQTQEVSVLGTTGESENVEQAQVPQGVGDQTLSSDGRAQSKSKMRFVSSASLRAKQWPPADGRPPRVAKPQSSLYSSNELGASEDEQEPQPTQPNYGDSQNDSGQNTNQLLMVSYKPAGPAQQLNYQQQLYAGGSRDQDEPSAGASSEPSDGSFSNVNFQRPPPPPYNESSESKSPSSSTGGARVSAFSNLSQSTYGNNDTATQTANLLKSLMRQQQQFQIKIAGPNEAGQWSSEDERLLNQFNLDNNRPPLRELRNQHHQRLPLMMASGPDGGWSINSTAGRSVAGAQNPFQNHYQQFVENLAMLKQLRAAQQHRPMGQPAPLPPPRLLPNPIRGDIFSIGGGNLTGGELAHASPTSSLEPQHFSHLPNMTTTTNSRYELASASDRFASKLRASNTSTQQSQSRPAQTLFTANDNFYVPNTSTSTSTGTNNNNKSSLDLLAKQQSPSQPPEGARPAQVDSVRTQAKPMPSSQDEVHVTSDVSNFIDSTNGLSNLALAFIFVVSLLTFVLIAASLIYRRRRGRVRYGGTSLASGRGGGGGGSHQTGGQQVYKSTDVTIGRSGGGRLNLTRAKNLMRSSFVGAGRGGGGGGENIPDTTDQSNVSSLKSVSRLSEGASNRSHPLSGNGQQGHLINTMTVQQRQLKSALKQPSQQKQQDLNNNNNNNNNNSHHNYINKYICANGGQQHQSGPSKASRFFGFGSSSGADKYQSADESTANAHQGHDTTLTSSPDSDIKTLNTRLTAGQQQQPLIATGGKQHPTSHKRIAAYPLTTQRGIGGGGGAGAKYKNFPPNGQQVPPVACLKHAVL